MQTIDELRTVNKQDFQLVYTVRRHVASLPPLLPSVGSKHYLHCRKHANHT